MSVSMFNGWSEHSSAAYQNTALNQLINFVEKFEDYRYSFYEINFQHFSENRKLYIFCKLIYNLSNNRLQKVFCDLLFPEI